MSVAAPPAHSSAFRRVDFHMHTVESRCAQREMDLDAMRAACAARGIRVMGVTDHVYNDLPPDHPQKVRKQYADRAAQEPRLYFAAEVDLHTPATCNIQPEIACGLDYKLVAANHFGDFRWVQRPESEEPREVQAHFVRMFIGATRLDLGENVVIPHPMFVYPGHFEREDILADIPDEWLQDAAAAAAERNVAVEISFRALRPLQTEMLRRFYRHCKAAGVKFMIGSDSHRLADVGTTHVVEPIVAEVGITDDDLWFPTEEARRLALAT